MVLKVRIVSFIALPLVLAACVDPIPFESQDEEPKLVIFGTLTQLVEDHEIVISRSGEFGELGTPVSGAIVEIIDHHGNCYPYTEVVDRYVLSKEIYKAEVGEIYKLSITLNDGESIESSWQEMPEPIDFNDHYYKVSFRKFVSESNVLFNNFFIDIFVSSPLKTPSGNPAYLRWRIDETYSISDFSCPGWPPDYAEICFFEVPYEFEQLRFYSAEDGSQETLEDFMVFSRVASPYIEFVENHYFNVHQHSISESTFNFWEKVSVSTNQTGSILDKIPAGIEGNLTVINGDTDVLGYFEVAAVTTGRVITTREEIGETLQIPRKCNPLFPYYRQPDYCCFCDLLPNQISRPEYWGE